MGLWASKELLDSDTQIYNHPPLFSIGLDVQYLDLEELHSRNPHKAELVAQGLTYITIGLGHSG